MVYSRKFPRQIRNYGKNPEISKTQILAYTKMKHLQMSPKKSYLVIENYLIFHVISNKIPEISRPVVTLISFALRLIKNKMEDEARSKEFPVPDANNKINNFIKKTRQKIPPIIDLLRLLRFSKTCQCY